MNTHIVIETESLQINGRFLPSTPSLEDFTAIFGPSPRHELHRTISNPPYHHWIWDECGIQVTGYSLESLRSVTFNPKPAPKGAVSWDSDGFELFCSRSGLNGMLTIFGVPLDSGDSPLSFHTRVYRRKPDTARLHRGEDELRLEADNTTVNFETMPGPRRGDLPSYGRLFLGLYSYIIDGSRSWYITFYFPDAKEAPKECQQQEDQKHRSATSSQGGCASMFVMLISLSFLSILALLGG